MEPGAGLVFAIVWFAVVLCFVGLEDPIESWSNRYPEESFRAGVLSLLSDGIGYIGLGVASVVAVAVMLLI